MAKFAGLVGYVTQEETSPGIWESVETEKKMRGDIVRLANTIGASDKVNDDVTLDNRISLVGDAFAKLHFMDIKYVIYLNTKWKVSSVEVSDRRIILTLGGVWNG